MNMVCLLTLYFVTKHALLSPEILICVLACHFAEEVQKQKVVSVDLIMHIPQPGKSEENWKSVVSGKPEHKLTVMVSNRNGFYTLSTACLGEFAILTKLLQVVMLLICIQEILSLILGQDIDCPDDLCDFPQSLQTNECIVSQFRP